MRQAAVVLTYPAHLLHTVATVRSIRQHHPEISDYIVVLDDCSNQCWSDYVSHARWIYGQEGCTVVQASQLDFLHYITRPWVRQQTIKLYLDQLLPVSEWFFSDGDCCLLAPWPLASRSAHPVPWSDLGREFVAYVADILIMPDWSGFQDQEQRYVTTSAPPVRDMRSQDLQALRQHVQGRHGQELWQIHHEKQKQPGFTPTEWELMDCFDVHVQKLPIQFQNLRSTVNMSWESDRGHDRDHWRAQNIDVPDAVWAQLPLARYL